MNRNRILFFTGIAILFFLFFFLEIFPGIHRGLERELSGIREYIETDFSQIKREIVIVDVDEKSLTELGRFQDWPRYYFGDVINKISRQNPGIIALDFIFNESDTLTENVSRIMKSRLKIKFSSAFQQLDSAELRSVIDTALNCMSFDSYMENSIKKVDKIILASYLTDEKKDAPDGEIERYLLPVQAPSDIHEFKGIVTPIPKFLKPNTGIGMINSFEDDDGVQRKSPVFLNFRGKAVPSFAFAVAENLVEDWEYSNGVLHIGERKIPLENGAFLKINYQGDFKTFLYLSFVDVLRGNIPEDILKGKIVLLGASSPGLSDISQTPYGGRLPSVEVQANAIHNLLYSRPVHPASPLPVILTILVLVFVTLWVSNKTPPYLSPFLVLFIICGYFVFNVAHYNKFMVAYELGRPVIGIIISFIAGVTCRIYSVEKEKKWIREHFSRYLPEEVVNQLVKNPTFSLEGERQELSVLFCDVRDFTNRAEKEKPEKIVNILNMYLEDMSDIIFSYQGMVDKFLGDGIMALFGAPITLPGHADKAVNCAIEMQKKIEHLNKREEMKNEKPLSIGIGISSGHAIVGNVGSESRADFTAVGDTVNTAARLEPLNKEYKSRIIISEDTRVRLKGDYKIHFIGKVLLKGKTRPTEIYSVDI